MLALSLSFLALQRRLGTGYNPGPTNPPDPEFDGYYIDDQGNRYSNDLGDLFVIQVPDDVSFYTDDQGNLYTDENGNVFIVNGAGEVVFVTDDTGNLYTDDQGNIFIL